MTEPAERLNKPTTGTTRVFSGRIFRTRPEPGGRIAFADRKPAEKQVETTRPLRAAQMLAQAHKAQKLIDSQKVESFAKLARRLGFTRARISQLLDLTLLAPDIQEEILFTEVEPSRDEINEHAIREVVRAANWSEQRRQWREILETK